MENPRKVFVVGSFNTDLAVRTPRMPVGGETILGNSFLTGPGGKGANQAVAAARLGAEVNMLVKLGKDAFGDLAEQNLIKEGVRANFILRSSDSHTGVAFIIVDHQGENMIVVAGGANNLLSPADVDLAKNAICESNILLTQLEIPLETVKAAVEIAHRSGVKVILNPAPARELDSELLKMVDILTPNETEAQLITGLPVNNVEQAEAAARELMRRGVKSVVITLGDQGALVVQANSCMHVPSIQVDVVDTTGAGDAFSGALAVGLSEGFDLEYAARFANVTAALQVTRMGTAPAMPYRSEVLAILEGNGK